MDSPLVSVIVPVYNAEKTLDRCIGSILLQKYRNIELILVNDGSTDASLSICKGWSEKDSRVIVVDKQNTGVSESRNIGMAKASGKYLQFVDSDDWVTENSTGDLVNRAEQTQCDIVIAKFYRVVNRMKEEKGNIKADIILNRKEFLTIMMKEPANFYYGVMWNKLYRRDIITAHRLRCCTDLNWCEDFLFNLDYIRYAETFACLNTPVYYYVKTKNSLVSRECTLNNIIRMKLKLFNTYRELYESMELYDEHRAQVRKFFIAYAKDSNVGYFFVH
jgi:glycosyltransferase involved in cell wall biosynthesis